MRILSTNRFFAQEQNSAHPFTIFHRLGCGAHGTDPWLQSWSSERSSANRVQRVTRPLCTDHYSLVKFRLSARPETEPPRSWESRDGQGGALLREVAKLEKFEDNPIETLGRTFWDVQQLSAAMAAALIT